MKILVVGSDSQLGKCLVQVLSLTEFDVVVVNKNKLDITDSIAVSCEIAKLKPDVIINTAAYTAVENAEKDIRIANAVNNLGVRNLAKESEKINALLIHFSTDYVFDGSAQQPYNESDLAVPLNVYGQTKLAGELAVVEEASKYFIIRTSWLFSEYSNNFFSKIRALLSSSKDLNVVNDQVGGPTFAGDLAAFIVALLHKYNSNYVLSWGIYHYAGYPFVSWYEFASYIQLALPEKNDCMIHAVTSDAYFSNVKRPLNSSLDSSKVQKMFGIAPSDWQEAVKSLVTQKEYL